jgi:diadenosine tetraphosphate (Ap4A) HIT family hydrolase
LPNDLKEGIIMVFPKEKYEEIEQLQKDAELEKIITS